MVILSLIPELEFRRVWESHVDKYVKLSLIADMCRANALTVVKRAGSGHLGSSFSSMDLLVWLYYCEMNVASVGFESPDRDIYFSSKGHDVPGLYSVLFSLGVLPEERFLKLRRLGGLDGHPDVSVRGIEANSGSLGMGISKGKGMAWAKQKLGRSGRVFVMTGDGELQEGQCYEALETAVQQHVDLLTAIVDHNKVQSDKEVRQIVDLLNLEEKMRAFGWYVARCNGHDFKQLEQVFAELKEVRGRPKILIADTIKGRGVTFMEHPFALRTGAGKYQWHAGAPNDESFTAAYSELMERIKRQLSTSGLAPLSLKDIAAEDIRTASPENRNELGEPVSQAADSRVSTIVSKEYVVEAFGQALVDIAATRPDLIVLDADLASDCRIRRFEETYPDRFIENGIAEQDMVSMAGGLARQGFLPVVNSFANFLVSRANEQIYNNASEHSKIIYVCHYAGLIPAGPGKSHQSIRDISLLAALPNVVILEPCNASETKMALDYCVNLTSETCALRLVIGPSPRLIQLPSTYRMTEGRGVTLLDGRDAVLFAYGPVMLHEALTAAEILVRQGLSLRVVNMPWLNRVDRSWLAEAVSDVSTVCILDDHSAIGGLGSHLLPILVGPLGIAGKQVHIFGVEGYPACGTPTEALRHHALDGPSLAKRILKLAGRV